jgi:hypothetical protein
VIVQVGTYSGLAESSFVTTFQATNIQSHNDLTSLQGGSSGEYYHLSTNQYNNIVISDGSQSVNDILSWNGTYWQSTSGGSGETGPQGPTGSSGITGSQGPTGSSGITGSQGPTGPSGESTVVLLTDDTLIDTDASLGNVFYVTLGGNRTLSNPTNVTSGKRIIWRIKQDATGGRTISLDTKFRLGTDITSVVLSTSPNVTDYIGAIYNAQDDKWDVIAFVKGFA